MTNLTPSTVKYIDRILYQSDHNYGCMLYLTFCTPLFVSLLFLLFIEIIIIAFKLVVIQRSFPEVVQRSLGGRYFVSRLPF